MYASWNKDGKNVQVVIVSGDRDNNQHKTTYSGFPWVTTPLGDGSARIRSVVPCGGYPTGGIIHGSTGAMIEVSQNANGWQETDVSRWLSKV